MWDLCGVWRGVGLSTHSPGRLWGMPGEGSRRPTAPSGGETDQTRLACGKEWRWVAARGGPSAPPSDARGQGTGEQARPVTGDTSDFPGEEVSA